LPSTPSGQPGNNLSYCAPVPKGNALNRLCCVEAGRDCAKMKRSRLRRYIKLSDAQALQDSLQAEVDEIKRASLAECLKKLAGPGLNGRKARAVILRALPELNAKLKTALARSMKKLDKLATVKIRRPGSSRRKR